MTRVIAGSAGGRRLQTLRGDHTRPTADRVKEALFSSLGDIGGLVVLDLFAGSGGLGIEALSRGAAAAVLVEHNRQAVALIRDNLRTAAVEAMATVVAATVQAFCRQPLGGPFDVVFVDAPYVIGLNDLAADLAQLVTAQALQPGARVILERDRRREEDVSSFLSHDHDRAYGDTLLRYFTHHPNQNAAEGAPTL